MRDYAKLAPTFWTGTTGKALRKKGPEALIVALYLVSAPGSNMLGLYYQPLLFMAHDTGLGIEGASKGLHACTDAGFCSYDDDTELVFVPEMAAWPIGEYAFPERPTVQGHSEGLRGPARVPVSGRLVRAICGRLQSGS